MLPKYTTENGLVLTLQFKVNLLIMLTPTRFATYAPSTTSLHAPPVFPTQRARQKGPWWKTETSLTCSLTMLQMSEPAEVVEAIAGVANGEEEEEVAEETTQAEDS